MRGHTAKNSREVKEGNIYNPYNAVSDKIHNSIFKKCTNGQWDTSHTSNAMNYYNTLQSSAGPTIKVQRLSYNQ